MAARKKSGELGLTRAERIRRLVSGTGMERCAAIQERLAEVFERACAAKEEATVLKAAGVMLMWERHRVELEAKLGMVEAEPEPKEKPLLVEALDEITLRELAKRKAPLERLLERRDRLILEEAAHGRMLPEEDEIKH